VVSVSFLVVFPIIVGRLVKLVSDNDNGTVTDDDFNDQFRELAWIVGITALVSLVGEWAWSDCWRVAGVRIAKELRYDIYLTYFKKCTKLVQPVDKVQSSKFFNFKDIEQDISTLEYHTAVQSPIGLRRKILSFASLVGLFVSSW